MRPCLSRHRRRWDRFHPLGSGPKRGHPEHCPARTWGHTPGGCAHDVGRTEAFSRLQILSFSVRRGRSAARGGPSSGGRESRYERLPDPMRGDRARMRDNGRSSSLRVKVKKAPAGRGWQVVHGAIWGGRSPVNYFGPRRGRHAAAHAEGGSRRAWAIKSGASTGRRRDARRRT